MKKIRLDDMNIDEVKSLYEPMFKNLISKEKLEEIYLLYLHKYNEMIEAEKKNYSVSSGMGRRYYYLKNVLYGWYIEDLFYDLILKNPMIKSIKKTGDDSEHLFEYDHIEKSIKISGKKTTEPDFLLTLNNNEKLYIELKTAAVGIFSIKTGNIKQLQKTMGYKNINSLVIMLDLLEEKYEIKDMTFFLNSMPFVNNRMEGQLCYDFPKPSKFFKEFLNEDFMKYINKELLENENIKKYHYLMLAEKNNDNEMKKIINNKMKLDDLTEKFELQKMEIESKTSKIIDKLPIIKSKTWDEIFKYFNNK